MFSDLLDEHFLQSLEGITASIGVTRPPPRESTGLTPAPLCPPKPASMVHLAGVRGRVLQRNDGEDEHGDEFIDINR